MKRLLLALALALPLVGTAQPILRNYYTTNANPSSSSNVINNFYATNIFATNITVTQTITVTTNLFSIAKGGHLTISTNITIMTNASLTFSNLPWPSVMVVGANGDLTNANLSGLTLSGNTLTAISASPVVTALTYSSATNVTMSAAGGTNFTLEVTNTVFMAAPLNPPGAASPQTCWTITFRENATGAHAITWTNLFKFPGGTQFQFLTNAAAVSTCTICTSPYTNGQYYVDYGILGVQ